MFCKACQRSREEDDKGASFGHGFLCRACGYYRSPEAPKPKKPKKPHPTADMPTPIDPGLRVLDFDARSESGL